MKAGQMIKAQMDARGLKHKWLAAELGYTRSPNMISQMFSGSTKVPPAKAIQIASILHLDPKQFYRQVLSEQDPALLELADELAMNT